MAGRIARLLLPASTSVGGFVSTELGVRLSGRRLAWPDVALACREPPADGRLDRPPELVVLLPAGPTGMAADAWLVAGASAVWSVGAETVVEHTRTGGACRRAAGEWAEVPGLPEVRLPVARLLEAAGGRVT